MVLGVASALLYGFGITARYPLAPGLQHARAGWATLMHYSLRTGLAHGAIYALLIAAYMLAMRLAFRLDIRQSRGAMIVIIGGWLLCSASLLGAYPGESLDIFDYLFRGRMLVEYGASPLATAPVAFNTRPFYEYLTWRGQVDTYGPLWEYASALVAWAVHYLAGRADSQIAYILGYRLLAVLLAGLSGILVVSIVRHSTPQLAPAALLAWLWNPLVLTTTAIGAHNDILMVLSMLASLWLLQRRRWVLGLVALLLAAHVKLTALLILPVVGLWLLRRCGWLRSIRIGALTLVVTLPLSWLLYAPLGGWLTLRRMLQERARLLINSPADLVYRLLQERYGWAEPDAWRTTTLGATLLFFAIAAGVLLWFWRQSEEPRTENQEIAGGSRFLVLGSWDNKLLWRGSVVLTLMYLLIGSFWFQHWYLLWLLAPAVLLPASRWILTLLPIYCLGALWSDLTNSFLRVIPAHPFTATQVGAINVLAQVTPLLLALVAAQAWQARSRILLAGRLAQPAGSRPATMPAQLEMEEKS
jgi:hypothetical protein